MPYIITPPLFGKHKIRRCVFSDDTIISSLFYTQSNALPSSKSLGTYLKYIGRLFDSVYENVIEIGRGLHNISH
jgi:hypothetical protein